jgi:hypothetical protein
MTATAMAFTVTTTAMTFAMAVTMMVAVNSRVVSQFSCQKIIYCCICITLNTAVQGNTCLSQGILSTTANATANQGIDVFLLQEGGQSTVTNTVAGENKGFLNRVIFNSLNFEGFRMAEMLENLAVIIGNCKFHRAVTSSLHR